MARDPSFETASEYLRLVLPLMSKFRIPLLPENYAVWFEYVSGANPGLKEILDRLIAAEHPIDEKLTRDLFQRFLSASNQAQLETARSTVKRLVETMNTSLNTADSEVTRFEQSLRDCAAEIKPNIETEKLRGMVSGLLQSTQQMHDGSAALHQHLAESRQEVEALREALSKARVEANSDPMTGLANRKGLNERFNALLASDGFASQPHCVVIADIDKFKFVNDTYGHLTGDKIIKAVATAIANQTKGKDLAVRFGGEEFVVLLPETPLSGGLAVAELIRKSIEKARFVNAKSGEGIRRVTISLGVAELIHGEPLEAALARADAALYRAKESGRNRVESQPATAPLRAVG